MKRFRLPTKLALAIAPIGLVALVTGGLVSWTSLAEAQDEERVAAAARVAADAIDALVAVSAERGALTDAATGEEAANLEALASTTDRAVGSMRESVNELVPLASGPASGIASTVFSNASLAQARLDDARQSDPLSQEAQDLFDEISNRLITVASQATLYLGDPGPAREGAGAVSLARASFASVQQEQLLTFFVAGESLIPVDEFEQRFAGLELTVVDWLNNADANSPTARALGLARGQVRQDGADPDPETFLFERDEVLADAASEILGRVAASADAAATTARNEAVTVAAVVLGALSLTVITALVLGRSTVRRVRSVTAAAQHVADVDLPRLVDALSNPKGKLEGRMPVEIEKAGPDEVGELARSFSSLHGTLVDVANRQMEILRRGVSEIFVTLARRNGSLVDRQLALIDELESREEDPETLDGYYKLDHLATRMRRNAESLLVLAGSESPRMWSEALDMGDVVRAALGEVDEYQRVDVLALEPARLKGKVVTDLAHLMSELLDNATQFSPPSERVRVTGLFDDDGYVITIADSGLGISEEKLADINRLIVDPPVLGLALEPTLGMYVVARLAARHGIGVRLVPGVPGTTVRITLPRELIDTQKPAAPALPSSGQSTDNGAEEPNGRVVITPHAFRTDLHRQTPNGSGTPSGTPEARPTTSPERAEPAEKPAETAEKPNHHPAQAPPSKKVVGPVPSPPSQVSAQPPPPPSPVTRAPAPAERGELSPGADQAAPRPTGPAREAAPSLPRHGREVPSGPVDVGRGHLPTRNPGSSFRETVETEASSSVSVRGAEGIRSALDGYRMGQDIASSSTGEAREPRHDEAREETDS